MKISIITPCYNSEKYINETIESVIYQKGNFEIEYIIVDGDSKDNTKKIVEDYLHKVNNKSIEIKCNAVKLILISEPDKGMYDALSKGLGICTGDIIAYINSDDFYLPNAFSTAVEIFSNHKHVNWITGMNINYNEKGQIIGCKRIYKYDSSMILEGIYGTYLGFIQQESTFWRKQLLGYINYTELLNYNLAGDYYLWHSFAKYQELFVCETIFAGFRIREGQLSNQLENYFKEFKDIKNKTKSKTIICACILKFFNHLPSSLMRKCNKKTIFYSNMDKKWIMNSKV